MAVLAILRVVKLKSFGNVGGSEAHTARLQETTNADPQKINIRLIGDNDHPLEEIVKSKIATSTKHKPRKNAVLCSEMFLSASPEYFRPHNPSQSGEWGEQLLRNFANTSKNWLISSYGDKCVRAELHLDEATPHIHAYIIPVNDRTKQLSHNEMFGGSAKECRIKLSQLQDNYAAALAPLGIERGVKGSKATHTRIKEYYQAVNSQPLTLELERLKPLPAETAQRLYARIKADPGIQALDHQLADRKRAIEHEQQLIKTAIASERLRQQQESRIKQLEAENLAWRQQTEQLRDLQLVDVAWELGLNHEQGRWKGHGRIINIDGSKFYDFSPEQQKGSGGAIDLVMHVNGCNFKEAVVWLHDRFGESGAERAALAQARKVTAEIIQLEPRPKFTPPVEDKSNWQTVHDYLTNKRGLPENFVQALYQRGLVYADAQQNAVFVMRDLNGQAKGAFLRGTRGENNTFKGYEKQTKRCDSWFHFHLGGQPTSPVEKVVLLKSPIDAMSFAMLEYQVTGAMPKQRTLYMAVDNPKSLPFEQLQHISTVEIAFGNDDQGAASARMAQDLLRHSTRVKPKARDWNEQLLSAVQNRFHLEVDNQHRTEIEL